MRTCMYEIRAVESPSLNSQKQMHQTQGILNSLQQFCCLCWCKYKSIKWYIYMYVCVLILCEFSDCRPWRQNARSWQCHLLDSHVMQIAMLYSGRQLSHRLAWNQNSFEPIMNDFSRLITGQHLAERFFRCKFSSFCRKSGKNDNDDKSADTVIKQRDELVRGISICTLV